MFGIPLFTLIVGAILFAAICGFIVGSTHWQRPAGKVLSVASGMALLVLVVVAVCVLITVHLGSMG